MSKTLFKMISIISILIAAVLLVFSVITGQLFRKTITEQTYEKNIEELNMISDNIGDMHDNVKQFALRLMENAYYDSMLHNEVMGSVQSYADMMELSQTIQVNPYIHSVSFYSGYTGEYFSTLTSRSGEDEMMQELVKNYESVPVLSPIARALPYEIYYTSKTVYSYFYYETDSNNKLMKAVSVNMDAQWICNYLNRLKGKNAKAYIIDTKTNTFTDGSAKVRSVEEAELDFLRDFPEKGSVGKEVVANGKNENLLVTYLCMKDPQWVIVVAEQNTEFQNLITAVRSFMIGLVSVLILFGVIVAVLVSRRIYFPWKEMVQKISGTSEQPRSSKRKMIYDDVSVMKTSIETANSKLLEYSHFKNSMKDLLLETYIRAVLQNDTLTISRLLEEDIAAFKQILSEKMMIILFGVDDWKKNKHVLKQSVKGCMIQISEKLFSTSDEEAHKSIKWIQRGRGEIYMVALRQDGTVTEEMWKERAALIQKQFEEENKCPVSFAVGGFAKGTVEMKECALETVLSFDDSAENKEQKEKNQQTKAQAENVQDEKIQEPKLNPDKHNAVVDAVREYIDEHYSEEIVLKSLASNFNFSPGYLGAMFKECVGMSVLEYTNEVRLEAAALMIQNTGLNMVDIMGKCGFINESNFYKLFKKKYGVTPRQYRMDQLTARK